MLGRFVLCYVCVDSRPELIAQLFEKQRSFQQDDLFWLTKRLEEQKVP